LKPRIINQFARKSGVKPHKKKFVAGSVPARSSRRMTIAGSFFGGGQGQLTHPEIIDDEQGHCFQEFQVLLRVCIRGRFSEFIKRRVRCAKSAQSLANAPPCRQELCKQMTPR
jgi:hypothetical protein